MPRRRRQVAVVSQPPWRELAAFRKLNGYVPHYAHPAYVVTTLNSLYGLHCKNESSFSLGTGGVAGESITSDIDQNGNPRLIFDVPVSKQCQLLRCDILYFYTDHEGDDAVSPSTTIYSTQDRVGALVNHPSTRPEAPRNGPSLVDARWSSTGDSVGDQNQTQVRAIRTDAQDIWDGFTRILVYPDPDVIYFTFHFREVPVSQLEDSWWDPNP